MNICDKMKAEINAIAHNCDPQIHIKSIKQIGEVIAIEIAEGEEKPYSSSSIKETSTSYKVSQANLPLVLSSLGAIDKGKINNVGALMFTANIEKYIRHSESILAAFKGTDKGLLHRAGSTRKGHWEITLAPRDGLEPPTK